MRKNLAIGTLGIAVLLVIGLLSPSWWTATNGRTRLNIGMLEHTECLTGAPCVTQSNREFVIRGTGGANTFFMVSTATHYIGLATAFMLFLLVYLISSSGSFAGTRYVGYMVIITILSIFILSLLGPGYPNAQASWGLWLSTATSLAGLVAVLLIAKNPESEGSALMQAAQSLGDDAQQIDIQRLLRTPQPLHTSVNEGAVRFEVEHIELTDEGITPSRDGKAGEPISWTAVCELRARRLPIDPPHEGAVFLDIVMDGDCPPLRITQNSNGNFHVLDGSALGYKDNLRRIANRVICLNPDVQIESASRPFLIERKTPPNLTTRDELNEFNQRYTVRDG